jgi:hypothetical protein
MKRTGHIRERSPGSFELRYSLGTDPATGRRRIATVTVRGTRKEAERELRRLLRALDTGDHVDPNRLTVREWLRRGSTRSAPQSRPGTFTKMFSAATVESLSGVLAGLAVTKLKGRDC